MDLISRESSFCKIVGEGRPDIAGIGIIIGFVGQALISLNLALWVFFLSKFGALHDQHDEGTVERQIQCKRLESVSDMIMIGNDIQMLLGVSYMITIFAIGADLDLYHLRLTYEIVSFVGVSNAAALVCWTFCAHKIKAPESRWRLHMTKDKKRISLFAPRYRITYAFLCLYAALAIYLVAVTAQWSPDREPGRCYAASLLISSRTGSHPDSDITYIVITAIYFLLVQIMAVVAGVKARRGVLLAAFLQFPLHLYMAISLRTENQKYLTGESENGWDFGQTTSMVLLHVAIIELIMKGYNYYRFEQDIEKYGMVRMATRDREGEAAAAPKQAIRNGTRDDRDPYEAFDERESAIAESDQLFQGSPLRHDPLR